jgi:hypothetical protein
MNIPDYILNGEYTTPIVAKVLDVPLRKVISMLERGYIHASIQEADGHGSKRLFSFEDVVRAFIIHRLESFGLSVVKLRFVSSILANPDQLALPFLLFDNHESWCPVGDTREASEAHIMGFLQYPTFSDDPSPALWIPIDQMREFVVFRISEMG